MSGFGIYVHWPYCARICPYCDFNVYRARGRENTPLIDAICADIATHGRRFGPREVDSVFLGGGTPSLLSGEEVARILDAARAAFELRPDCEITLECNPEDALRFAEHAQAGVNRFSIGAQAFDDDALKKLGRAHDAAGARAAVDAAADTGQRVSLDLIYAREGQSIEGWRAELREALTLPIEHVSLYQLTIEPETAFARRAARGDLITPNNDEAAAFYEATQDICEAAGFPAYEISNHARSPESRARHNLLYWRAADWIGVGPGAHGRIAHQGDRLATETQRRPADYVDAVAEHGIGWLEDSALTGEQSADEALLMGLRLEEGVDRARIEAMRGKPLNQKAIDWLIVQGLLTQTMERLALTRAGRVLTNRIVAELVT
jgi:putative oxygen-independent coproporphyrinogen III oxidase